MYHVVPYVVSNREWMDKLTQISFAIKKTNTCATRGKANAYKEQRFCGFVNLTNPRRLLLLSQKVIRT